MDGNKYQVIELEPLGKASTIFVTMPPLQLYEDINRRFGLAF